jgi:hypothetical protein
MPEMRIYTDDKSGSAMSIMPRFAATEVEMRPTNQRGSQRNTPGRRMLPGGE